MTRIERYIFRTSALAFLAGLCALTAVVWITQALRQFDLLTSKGQTILVFLFMTGLTIPLLVAIIAPVALFIGVLYALNKLNGDSELVVMSAAGVPPGALLRPFLLLATLVFGLVGWMTLQAVPSSFDAVRALTARIHADFIANFARPGAFSELESGFVFHYRERGPDGSLRGVFMQDRRDPAHISSYIAERGRTIEKNGANYLVLEKGSYQKPAAGGDSAIVTFEDYTIDLTQFAPQEEDAARRPRERSTSELLSPNPKDETATRLAGRFRAELVDRLSSPFYAFVAGLIGFAALGEARTTRQGRGLAMISAILAFAAIRLGGIAATSFIASRPRVEYLAWALPLVACLLCLDVIFSGPATGLIRRLALQYRTRA
jgi:lipopolysaccharide export system permease protein